MKILLVPMFALSRMSGPWSRAQKIAAALAQAGHQVTLGIADDGNCKDPVVASTLELPAPSPLGLPMAISSRTFPLATKLGIAGRKPVHSFEEVLWLTGTLAYSYERESVQVIRDFIQSERPDLVYSEFNLPVIIAAEVEGVPCVGTASYPTQVAYASSPGKAGGVRRLLGELGLPQVSSSLELFSRMEHRFVPSCPQLEPLEGEDVTFCGFLNGAAQATTQASEYERDAVVIYMGTGSIPSKTLERVARELASRMGVEVFLAGVGTSEVHEGSPHRAPRFDFSMLLPRARVFVNHGGQNSVMDALAYGVPQVIYPGKVFERRFNAESIQKAGAGIRSDSFDADHLIDAIERLASDVSTIQKASELRTVLTSLGGTSTIVSQVEDMFG